MSGRLANKIAVITGSSSGIGRAIALAFASHGAKVICSDLHEEPRNSSSSTATSTTVQAIRDMGGTASFKKCDTTSESDISALISHATTSHGRIDILLNNAGIALETSSHGPQPIWSYASSAFDTTLAVNTRGVFLGIKYAAAAMKGQTPFPGSDGEKGCIVNLASVFGLRGGAGSSGYVASKHAVMGLTRAAALDCAPVGVRVNALCPGYTRTAFTESLWGVEGVEAEVTKRHPLKGVGAPGDVASAAVFLASADAAWVTGVGLPVDGGYSCM